MKWCGVRQGGLSPNFLLLPCDLVPIYPMGLLFGTDLTAISRSLAKCPSWNLEPPSLPLSAKGIVLIFWFEVMFIPLFMLFTMWLQHVHLYWEFLLLVKVYQIEFKPYINALQGNWAKSVKVFCFNPRNVLTFIVEASTLHFCLSLVLNNSSSEARGKCKDLRD